MSTRMLACMTPKNTDEEAIESTYSDKTSLNTTRPDLRRLKSFTCQFKDLLAKVTAGAYKHSCKPCTASMYDHDAEHAVHPVPYSDTTTEMQSGQFSLPSHQYRYTTTPQRAYTTVPSWGAMQGSLADQKLNRKSSAHYWDQGKHSNQVVYGASVRMAEETRASNGAAPTGQCLPGTEWFSQVELGVFITFISLSNGCNTLKRIRFSRDIFSKREAESWWMENSNRICAIYHVPPFERATNEPTSSSEEEVSGVSGYATPAYSAGASRGLSQGASMKSFTAGFSSPAVSSMRDATSVKAESVIDERPNETEGHESEVGSEHIYDDVDVNSWVEEDVPGVYLTIMNLPEGGRGLKRVRFSRKKFTEKQAKIWWDENRGRIHKQYL
ncbi:hypothetical protein BDL97_04G036700 [Sphagnum fallax]|nr:hypothetical protein BDL97_04G036700 [Sphagnum fallax]